MTYPPHILFINISNKDILYDGVFRVNILLYFFYFTSSFDRRQIILFKESSWRHTGMRETNDKETMPQRIFKKPEITKKKQQQKTQQQ